MNTSQLKKQIGRSYRLRPLAIQIDGNGLGHRPIDDGWRLEAVEERPTRLTLVNERTGESLVVQSDNVREYRSPDFLVLRCQVVLSPGKVSIEPILDNRRDVFDRLEKLMGPLLQEMRDDLTETPLKREVVLLERAWSYRAKGTELAYYADDHADLPSKFEILENHQLATNITYNNVTRYQLNEELVRYLGF